ncbi:hypothetical protein C8J57DRAFT_1505124 [Mycena rebaudengoi]|nr:hypothetical protein C8J57DRAFT_1505124 [Mycena rebaudengoi]
MTGMKFSQLLFLLALDEWSVEVSVLECMLSNHRPLLRTVLRKFRQFGHFQVSNRTLQDPVLNVTVGFALPGGESFNFPDELIVLGGVLVHIVVAL